MSETNERTQCKNLMKKYPDRVPVIIIHKRQKHKYLIPYELSLGKFMIIFRKKITLSEGEALFVYAHSTQYLLSPSLTFSEIYRDHKNKNGCLRLEVCLENTFG